MLELAVFVTNSSKSRNNYYFKFSYRLYQNEIYHLAANVQHLSLLPARFHIPRDSYRDVIETCMEIIITQRRARRVLRERSRKTFITTESGVDRLTSS